MLDPEQQQKGLLPDMFVLEQQPTGLLLDSLVLGPDRLMKQPLDRLEQC